ncbi:hypothetical protein [Aeoliella sp.]|uniref:hypothetical protein n=1 Tax=Aeoliella sp. TaxID=2795800 RepID=UPI003CCB7BB1
MYHTILTLSTLACITSIVGCSTQNQTDVKTVGAIDGADSLQEEHNFTAVKLVHAQIEATRRPFQEQVSSANGTIQVRSACNELLSKLQAIDASGCPADYREEFEELVCNVEEMCSIMESHPTEPPQTQQEIAFADESQERLMNGINSLSRSDEELDRVAERYGLDIDRGN